MKINEKGVPVFDIMDKFITAKPKSIEKNLRHLEILKRYIIWLFPKTREEPGKESRKITLQDF
ncbi:MAG: hypothetical protein LBT43_13550 [Prevotella sp.]|jgi:hypothetical protein|nr:hypothetical protein [Prevotella sp.]